MLFQFYDDCIISISLVKHIDEKPFITCNVKQLDNVYPLVKSILTEWRKKLTQPKTANLEHQLDSALVKFGSSVLTPKEGVILHGYSIKYIAEKLENSLETIKHTVIKFILSLRLALNLNYFICSSLL